MKTSNLIGALCGLGFLLSAGLVFVFRLIGRPEAGRWLGWFEIFLSIPLVYLLSKAAPEGRGPLYIVQIVVILIWLLLELLLDYVFQWDFRQVRWMVIIYVTLFFAAAGGCVGIATNAGRGWSIVSVILFLGVAALAFIQRKVTGL